MTALVPASRRSRALAHGVRLVVSAGLVLALSSATAAGQTAAPGQPPDEQKPLTWQAGATRTVRLFPPSDVYPVYVADPHRPTNAIVEAVCPVQEMFVSTQFVSAPSVNVRVPG